MKNVPYLSTPLFIELQEAGFSFSFAASDKYGADRINIDVTAALADFFCTARITDVELDLSSVKKRADVTYNATVVFTNEEEKVYAAGAFVPVACVLSAAMSLLWLL